MATVSPDLPNTPILSDGGIVNAAGFVASPVAPGSVAAIFGANFSNTTTPAFRTPLPTSLANTTVWFDLARAPLFFTSSSQANVQVPALPTKRVQVVVNCNGIASLPMPVTIVSSAPGIFVSADGSPIIVHNSTGGLVTESQPTRAGDVLIVYASGLAPSFDAPSDGSPTPVDKLYPARGLVTVRFDTTSAEPTFAGLAPYFVAIDQINVIVPPGLRPGQHGFQIVANGAVSNSVNIYVQN